MCYNIIIFVSEHFEWNNVMWWIQKQLISYQKYYEVLSELFINLNVLYFFKDAILLSFDFNFNNAIKLKKNKMIN